MTKLFRRLAPIAPILVTLAGSLQAQPDRITAQVEGGKRAVLRGNIHPRATAGNDQGPVEASFKASGMTLLFRQSPAQRAAAEALLAEQQDSSSPQYHQWLTPEQYAGRFGASASDIAKVTAWLESEGFSVDAVARGRNWVQFSGTASQIQNSFHTQLRRYNVDGKAHYANATEPSIPAAFSDLVLSIRGLHDFHPKPHIRKELPRNNAGGFHNIVPDDLATIYDISPLYKAGIDGTGQKIAIVGQTSLDLSDIQAFRTRFNLPSQTPDIVLVPKRTDPGRGDTGALAEADLDIEWAGGIARNATIVYVYTDDAFAAAAYVIDQNLAPVLSMSYGYCELTDLIDMPYFQALAQQANSQGITWIAATGDFGAGDCEDSGATLAQVGLAIDLPSALPEVTAVGGTEFSEGLGTYWASANNVNGGSALSYIPEIVWNDTNPQNGFAAGGGGASVFFPKPSWQVGSGAPNDGARDVPDISLASSVQHDVAYVFTNGSGQYWGGTSVGAPLFAGMVALLNHYLTSAGIEKQSGLGNVNPGLYRLAQTPGIFHDVTSGNNSIPCAAGSPNCDGGSFGYKAGPGYDQASGLGSLDVANFVHGWSSKPAVNSAVVPSADQNPVYQTAADRSGNLWVLTLSLTEEAGVATTLTDFTVNGESRSSQIKSLFGTATIPAGGFISTNGLGFATLSVPTTVVFGFTGVDASGRNWSTQLTVPFEGPQPGNNISGVSNAASFKQSFAPGMIMSVFGVQMGLSTVSATAIPLPDFLSGVAAYVNNVPAPLYYVSPVQLNIQIPYETKPGSATLEVDTPYAVSTFDFQVAAAGPGIFTFGDGSVNPSRSGSRGKIYFLYVTGEGLVTPALTTGTTPSPRTPTTNLPKPKQSVTVSIGNVPATIQFIGIPSGLVGVTQINFTVAPNTPLGPQPVVVSVGGVDSPPAMFTVNP